MSKCFPMRCMGCGRVIVHLYDAYLYLRRQIMASNNQTHIEMAFLDHTIDQETSILYEIFHIDSECCKKHFLTAVLPKDLEMVGDYIIKSNTDIVDIERDAEEIEE